MTCFDDTTASLLAWATIRLGVRGRYRAPNLQGLRSWLADGVDFQSVPADEAERAGYSSWRLDAARTAQEQTQDRGPNAMPKMKMANWI